jgi:hypothetical protein
MTSRLNESNDTHPAAAHAGGAPVRRSSSQIDTTVPHSARIWNYWLGGKDNYAIDRETGDRVHAMLPSIVDQARADRAFLGRAVRYLAGKECIRQFLDVGTGLPSRVIALSDCCWSRHR